MNGGELVVQTLQRAGVTKIFGLHGAHIDTIFQACLDQSVEMIDTRHEAAAGHAAEGFARTTCGLGVALVTAGGGFTNVVTPLANAYLDRTPLLVLTGSGPLDGSETNTLQAGIDQVAVAKPITKWAVQIGQTKLIPRLLAQAIRIATSAPRGPVLVDLPWNVLLGTVADDDCDVDQQIFEVAEGRPTTQELARLLTILRGAERPVIVVGSEALRGRAGDDLASFVARSGVPVFSDYEGFSLLNALGEARMGLIQGLWGFADEGMQPDVVLMLGVRFGLHTGHGSGAMIPETARILQIDPDARELGRLRKIDLGIVADVAASIEALAQEPTEVWKDHSRWRVWIAERLTRELNAHIAAASPGMPLHPLLASVVLCRHLSEDVGIVADGALTYLWLSECIGLARPVIHLCHGYLGSMGVGFGTALGAQVALSALGKRAILVTGDGSVGYSFAEFDSLVRHGLPLIVVIMNNRSWGATLQFQQMFVGDNRVTNTLLENGEYHLAAAAFGADAYYAETEEQLDQALRSALAAQRPACINVRVDVAPVPPATKTLSL